MANDNIRPAVIVLTKVVQTPQAMTLEELIERSVTDKKILDVIYRRVK